MLATENITVATIITFGTIITALLGYLGVVATGARRHAKAARHEVQNSHDVNLRDDLDEKFEGLADLFKTLTRDVGGIKEDIRIIHREASQDRDVNAAERERVRRLEEKILNTKEQ